MRIPRIYQSIQFKTGEIVSLDEAATRHISQVLRLKTGYLIYLFNGENSEYLGELQDTHKRHCTVLIKEQHATQTESLLHLHVGQAISRGDRMDYTIQKAVELGVSSVTPLWTERCQVKLDEERQDKRLAHWQNIAIAACEQSGRTQVPHINAPQSLNEWLAHCSESLRLVLSPHEAMSLDEISVAQPTAIALLIGPEGGLTDAEIEQARATGFKACRLGPRVLRTETAVVVALSLLQDRWGDI